MANSFLYSEKINALSLPLSQSSCISFTLHFSPLDALILLSQPPQVHRSTSPGFAPCLLQGTFLHLSILTCLKSSGLLGLPGFWSARTSPVFVSALTGELLESTTHQADGTAWPVWDTFPKILWRAAPSFWLESHNQPHSPTEGFAEYSQCSKLLRVLMDCRHWKVLPLSVAILCTG